MSVFEKLKNLDGVDFDKKRQSIIRDFLESCEPARRKKMMAMQYNIDMRLQNSNDPQVEIFAMMWESFIELNRALNYGVKPKKDNVVQFPGR